MARAQFQKGQKVWVECVGAWAQIEQVQPVWAKGFEELNAVQMLIVTPLTFLGGSFYSIKMLPEIWQKITLFNPVVYLISGFRWAFYGQSDVGVGISLAMTAVFLAACLGAVWWIFRTGYRLKV